MVERTGSTRFLASIPDEPRPARSRRSTASAPGFEALEGRLLLANGPTPQELGAAYQEVSASQVATLNALGNAYRQVQAAALRSSQEATAAIAQLAPMIATNTAARSAYVRDLRILGRIQSLSSQAEDGLLISAGIENQTIVSAKADIVNGVFLISLQSLVETTLSDGAAIARRGEKSSAFVVAELDALGAQVSIHATRTGASSAP